MSDSAKCPASMNDWYGTTCGRPVKHTDGLCGIHHNAKERRAQNDRWRATTRAAIAEAQEEMRAIAERFIRLGYDVSNDSARIYLPGDAAETLITRLEELS